MFSKLTEALALPPGASIISWLSALERAALSAASAVLPPAQADERGRYPEQWGRLEDATSDTAVVVFRRYEPEEGEVESTYFAVPYTVDGMGTPTMGAPVEVEPEAALAVTWVPVAPEPLEEPAPPGEMPMSDDQKIAEAIEAVTKGEGLTEATELFHRLSGRHPRAAELGGRLIQAWSSR